VNNPIRFEFCFKKLGRADIEGSKSDVDKDSEPPQASYPCGNFSSAMWKKLLLQHGALGHAFTVCIRTENQNQSSFSPYGRRLVSVESELLLECLRYILTGIPPQSNSPPDTFRGTGRGNRGRAR